MELSSIMSIIGIGISLLIAGFNAAIFVVIKFNDMVHLDKNLQEIKDSLKELDKKLDNNAERISAIEGKCKATHG